jgi:hypothetical protein
VRSDGFGELDGGFGVGDIEGDDDRVLGLHPGDIQGGVRGSWRSDLREVVGMTFALDLRGGLGEIPVRDGNRHNRGRDEGTVWPPISGGD